MITQRALRTGESTEFVGAGGLVWQYEYTLKDHLGNTRVTFADLDGSRTIDPNTEISQINHYYPFGLNMEGNWNGSAVDAKNKYQYNDKELQTDFGLNWNDYGARMYDAAIGKWNAIDPKVEEYTELSPYNYGINNPIRFIDPDGMSAESQETKVVNTANGQIIYDDGEIDGNLYLVNDSHFDGRKFNSLCEVTEAYGQNMITACLSSKEDFANQSVKWTADEKSTLDYVKSQMNFMGLPPSRFREIYDNSKAGSFGNINKITDKKTGKIEGMDFGYGIKLGLANPLVFRLIVAHEKQHAKDIIDIANGKLPDFKSRQDYEASGYATQYFMYMDKHYDKATKGPKDLPYWFQTKLKKGAQEDAGLLLRFD